MIVSCRHCSCAKAAVSDFASASQGLVIIFTYLSKLMAIVARSNAVETRAVASSAVRSGAVGSNTVGSRAVGSKALPKYIR